MLQPENNSSLRPDDRVRPDGAGILPDTPDPAGADRRSWLPFAVLVLGLLLAVFGLTAWSRGATGTAPAGFTPVSGQTGTSGSPDGASLLSVVARGQTLLKAGTSATAGSWPAMLAAGQRGIDEYLVRLFTSPAYLAASPSDEQFIRDAWQVVTGAEPDDAAATAARGELTASGSRLAWLAALVRAQGWPVSLTLPANPTRQSSPLVLAEIPPAQTVIIGKLAIHGQAQIQGEAARVRLFSDGRFHASAPVSALDASVLPNDRLYWDTNREPDGSHRLSLLVQTSDGRGQWLDLAEWLVPERTPLTAGLSMTDQLPGVEPDREGWYTLDLTRGPASLHLLEPSLPAEATLYDPTGQSCATTAAQSGEMAVLHWPTSADADICYVHLVPLTAGKPCDFSLIQADRLAMPSAEPDRYLAVLDQRDEQWLVQLENDTQAWVTAPDYTLIDLTARLAGWSLTQAVGASPDNPRPDEERSAISPAFERETTDYGLYVPARTTTIALNARACEGSAASLALTRQANDGEPEPISLGEPVPLAESVNTLTLTVTGFDGSSRAYQLTVLRPPHRDGYEAVLDQYPLSYRSALWQLHRQQPSYTFIAEATGIDWTALLDAEDEKDRSLVEADSSPASWVETDSPVYDGQDWKAASRDLIAYFADPRNFLNQTDIFQFESQTYVPALHQKAGIEAMLADTFMAAGNQRNIDYAALFLEAGQNADISPFFLAAKSIQEMGRQGQSPLAFGELSGYEGLYNFYNIGATPNPSVDNGAQINGARFARYGAKADEQTISEAEARWLLPWTSPRQAIIGGAIWIAEGYVAIGQDTLYLQKFDLVAADGLFIHQYAQNIQMAWAEGRRTRRNYQTLGLLDQPFTFRIPIYTARPARPAERP